MKIKNNLAKHKLKFQKRKGCGTKHLRSFTTVPPHGDISRQQTYL